MLFRSDQLAAFPSSILADVAGRRGALSGRIAPLSPSMRVAGSALTVEVRPGDNLMIHVALALAQPGVQKLSPYVPGKPVDELARELNLDPAKIVKLARETAADLEGWRKVEAIYQWRRALTMKPSDDDRAKLEERLRPDYAGPVPGAR